MAAWGFLECSTHGETVGRGARSPDRRELPRRSVLAVPPAPGELGGAGDGRGQPPPLPPSARVLDLSFPGGRGCCH